MGTVSTYGRNLKRLREAAELTQEQLAQRLGTSRQGNLPSIEGGLDVPEAPTVLRHAEALNCLPSELMRGVRTVYDRIRDGEYDGETDATDATKVDVSIGAKDSDVKILARGTVAGDLARPKRKGKASRSG